VRRVAFPLATGVLAAGCLAAVPAVASLRVNEFVPRPRGNAGEWIELVNTGAAAVAADGWSVADATGRRRRIEGGVSIPPGGFLVLAASPESLRAAQFVPDSARVVRPDGWPVLNDHDAGKGLSADAIVLVDPRGGLADSVAYFESWLPPEPGRSVERADPSLPGTLPAAWGWSDDPSGGTPGRPNTLGSPLASGGDEPWSGPERVRPVEAPAVFLYRVPGRGRLGVWLVDLDGNEVAVLQDPFEVLSAGRWVWGSGMPLPPRSGPYLVCMRWQGEGPVLRRCVAVWVTR
jgi:hypothetical protein